MAELKNCPFCGERGSGMIEYIEKQAAVETAMQYCPDDDGSCSRAGEDIRSLLDELENLPPADVRPVVRGEWIDERWYGVPVFNPVPYLCFATCSACKQESIVNIKRGKKEWEIDSDIYPRCGSYNGADMRGGDADG